MSADRNEGRLILMGLTWSDSPVIFDLKISEKSHQLNIIWSLWFYIFYHHRIYSDFELKKISQLSLKTIASDDFISSFLYSGK